MPTYVASRRTLLMRMLRVPTERGAGRTWGRLTIADARNSAGCPVVDAATTYTERHHEPVVHARGVVVALSPRGYPAVAISWRGAPDLHRYLMRLRHVPLLRRLIVPRGHRA